LNFAVVVSPTCDVFFFFLGQSVELLEKKNILSLFFLKIKENSNIVYFAQNAFDLWF